MSREQLLHDGSLVPSKIVLSHEEQLGRLAASCPEAISAAVVVGDLCHDRIAASQSWRARYRSALGLHQNQRLVVVTSTWGPDSLLGSRPELPARLLADLPADEYRVAAIVHPNIWHGHGPWQVRTWLADCRRAGLLLVPPREGWRAALVAADCVIGDHGSVTLYGAMSGRPTILAAFAENEIDPTTTMAKLGDEAPRLQHQQPLRPQVDQAITGYRAGRLADLANGAVANPGAAARILRDTMYALMDISPPTLPPRLAAVPPPAPETTSSGEAALAPALLASAIIEVPVADDERTRVRVERYPAEVDAVRVTRLADPHLVVDDTEPDQRLRHMADVLVRRDEAPGGTVGVWLAGALDRHPACSCAAAITADDHCVIRLRDGRTVELSVTSDSADPAPPSGDPAVFASAVQGWLATGRDVASLGTGVTVEVGHTRIRTDVTVHPESST